MRQFLARACYGLATFSLGYGCAGGHADEYLAIALALMVLGCAVETV